MIKEGLFDTVVAYKAFLKAGLLPSHYIKLSKEERAFIAACIEIETEKKRR
ncbi:MAG: hypothetical protein LKJ25_01640 [Clostridia bacterium]|jgi:hypothetical protein|nr:hypothetical protein [Clostridia bacterium]